MCPARIGQPVFLLSALRLVWNGHFNQARRQRWLQVTGYKAVPVFE
jgi:hypothetical protein